MKNYNFANKLNQIVMRNSWQITFNHYISLIVIFITAINRLFISKIKIINFFKQLIMIEAWWSTSWPSYIIKIFRYTFFSALNYYLAKKLHTIWTLNIFLDNHKDLFFSGRSINTKNGHELQALLNMIKRTLVHYIFLSIWWTKLKL